ncbi:hypothetical protein [Streptomyces luteireticuli]|uniref:hypothetical protein n=1 Tax=Streptomyces luteireticuli TaxID=173858 RepID=UPI003556E99E
MTTTVRTQCPTRPLCTCSGTAHSSGKGCALYAPFWFCGLPRPLPTGIAFCAVRLAEHHAREALEEIGPRPGPVFADHDQAYVVLPARTSAEAWPSIARFCGPGTFVTVPAPQSTATGPAGLRWLVNPRTAKARFTPELMLRTALSVLVERLDAHSAHQ